MKTLFSALRRRRGIAARRPAGAATLRAAAFAAAAAGVAGVAAADPVPEPPLPSDYAKSQPQKSVAEAINKHRPEWKRFLGKYPVGHPKDDGTGNVDYDFYDYDYQANTKHERFRQLRGLKPEEQQRALAQLSGEIYASLPIARARLEDQTYRNLGYLLRPDGVFAGAGVGPVIAAPVGVGAGPVPVGSVGFNAASFGPAYPAPVPAPYGGPIGGPVGGPIGGPIGGIYGGGFAPGIASDGLNVVGPVAPGYGAPGLVGPGVNGPIYGGQNLGPAPDPAFGPGVAAGTPVPAGSYLTPDGRLVGPDGQPVRPGRPGVNNGPSGVNDGPVGPDGQALGANGVNGGVGPNGLPIGPNGQPIRPNGPNFGAQGPGSQGTGPQGTGPQGINGLAGPGAGPGLNAPGAAGGLNGAGTPIPAGSTFGPNGEVIAPDGRVLGGGSPVVQNYGGPNYGGPNYGGPVGPGPVYGGPNFGGPVGPGPVYGGSVGGPGLIGPGYGGPAYGPGAAPIAPLVGPPVGGFGGGVIAGPAPGGPVLGGLVGGPPVGGVLGGWVTGYYVDGDLDGTDHRSGVDYDLGGVNFGLARQVSPTLLLGGFVGFGHVNGEANRYDLGHYDVDTFQFGAYARKLLGNFYLIGAATFGIDDYDVNRNVDYGFIQRPATAHFSGHTASVFGELGYTKAITCSHFFQPFASLQYTRVYRGAFQEEGKFDKDRFNDYFEPNAKGNNKAYKFARGGDDYGSNLFVGETEDDFLRARIGARYFRRLRNCKGTFRVLPELRAYYAHEEYDPDGFNAAMCDMKDCPFYVAGLDDVNDAFVLGGGLTFAHCCGLSLYGNTDVFLADRDEAVALSGGTQFVW